MLSSQYYSPISIQAKTIYKVTPDFIQYQPHNNWSAASKTLTQTLDLDTQKTCTLRNLDPKKHESWKTWNKCGIKR